MELVASLFKKPMNMTESGHKTKGMGLAFVSILMVAYLSEIGLTIKGMAKEINFTEMVTAMKGLGLMTCVTEKAPKLQLIMKYSEEISAKINTLAFVKICLKVIQLILKLGAIVYLNLKIRCFILNKVHLRKEVGLKI